MRRHPHVFGDRTIETSGDVVKAWDQIKRDERASNGAGDEASPFASIPRSLPALARAQTLLRRARSRGLLDVNEVPCADSPETDHEIVRRIVALVAEAEAAGIDAEQSLRQWTSSFERAAASIIQESSQEDQI